MIGVAQEKARSFKAHKRCGPQGGVTFDFTRQSVAANHYYFYVQDPAWGPAFVKIGTYPPSRAFITRPPLLRENLFQPIQISRSERARAHE